jgi:fucose permease
VFASWASRIPEARQALDLTAGRLGLLLLALSAGAVVGLPAAGTLTSRVGAARTVAAGGVVATCGLALVGVGAGGVHAVAVTAAGLFLQGLGSATWDVAMNVEGAAVERRLNRTIMPRFHAGFSLGTVVGAGLGALAAWAELPIGVHLPVLAAVCGVAVLLAVRSFLPVEGRASPGAAEPRSRLATAWTEPRTLLIGVLVFAMAFTEGTANDWLALALVQGYEVPPALGAVGFGVFVAAMTAGRMWGTVALDRWGRLPALYATTVLAAVGVLTVVLSGSLVVAVAGTVLWGLGVSLGFPVGMSAAADDEEHAAQRVSVVATIGYLAFLAGPPLLGLLGDRVGVLRALLVVAVLLVPATAVVHAARPPRPGHD